jgi:serine protease
MPGIHREFLAMISETRALASRRVASNILFGVIVACALAVAPHARAAAEVMIQNITIRMADSAVAPSATTLPDAVRDNLSAIARNSLTVTGRTKFGAYVLELSQPLPFVEAQAMVNLLRSQPEVLWASLGSPEQRSARAKLASSAYPSRPVTRMIVKYRDPGLQFLAERNAKLPDSVIARLSSYAGGPTAHGRAMSNGAWLVRLFRAMTEAEAAAVAAAIEADPEVEYAEPDAWAFPQFIPNDTYYAVEQYDLHAIGTDWGINMPGAWDLSRGSASLVIADLNTGILAHPDLVGRTVAGYDMIADCAIANDAQPGPCTWTVPGVTDPAGDPDTNSRDADPSDPGDWVTSAEAAGGLTVPPYNYFKFYGCSSTNSTWHGTHVAGTIGANSNNATGIAGVNHFSMIQPVRVLGKCGGNVSDILDAITWASGGSVPGVPDNKPPNFAGPAKVINISFAGINPCGAYQPVIDAALGRGTVIVVSAGNSNTTADGTRPANCNGVITVAAIARSGERAYYSNYDDNVAPGPFVAIAAPGGQQGFVNDPNGILSTLNTGTTAPGTTPADYVYRYYQGTSMSAPLVTGVVSLMLSTNNAQTPGQILAKLQSTAHAFGTGSTRDCVSNVALADGTVNGRRYCGAGVVDAQAAVRATVDKDSIAVFDPASRGWYLRVNNEPGVANFFFTFGAVGDLPIVGDWDGNGTTTIGVYRPSTGDFFLRNTNASGVPDVSFQFGAGGAGYIPLAGDWDGNGTKTIGLYDPTTGSFFLKNSNSGGLADLQFTFGGGGQGYVPLVGDWDGNGTDTIGLYQPSTGTFFLRNTNSNGPADHIFTFGPGGAGWKAVVGDWDGDGKTTVGAYVPATGTFFLSNTNPALGNTGIFADKAFSYGPIGGMTPLAGDWDNLP